MNSKENKMGTKKLFPLIVTMSIPPAISMMIQSLYNIIDSIFVAKYSEAGLTAVSLAFPIQNLILALAVGFGVGINAYVARQLGKKNSKKAGSAATHGIIFALLHYVIILVLGLMISRPFLSSFTANEEILNMSIQYTNIVLVFSICQIIQIAIEKILQAQGQMVVPMVMQITGAVVNIILDPILIFGLFGAPALGVKGAAIATGIGQFSAMMVSIVMLLVKKYEVQINFKGFKFDRMILKGIYSIAIPSFFIMAIGSFMVSGINYVLLPFTENAILLFGIYFKLQTFVYMPTCGLVQGVMPIMSYNYGARNKDRLKETLKISIVIAIVFAVVGELIFSLWPQGILSMFTESNEIIEMGITALRIISIGYVFGAYSYIIASYLQAIGSAGSSLIITLARQLIVLIPISFIFREFGGLTGVWLAFPAAEIITCITAFIIFKKTEAKLQTEFETISEGKAV